MPLTGDPLACLPRRRLEPLRPPPRRSACSGSTASPLPNLECLSIQSRKAPTRDQALFLMATWRADIRVRLVSIESALSSAYSGPLIVDPGDRLVVKGQRPDGVIESMFDGLAIDFGLGIAPEEEEATISAVGIARVLLDVCPRRARVMRNSGSANIVLDTATDLPGAIQPQGHAELHAGRGDGGLPGGGLGLPVSDVPRPAGGPTPQRHADLLDARQGLPIRHLQCQRQSDLRRESRRTLPRFAPGVLRHRRRYLRPHPLPRYPHHRQGLAGHGASAGVGVRLRDGVRAQHRRRPARHGVQRVRQSVRPGQVALPLPARYAVRREALQRRVEAASTAT